MTPQVAGMRALRSLIIQHPDIRAEAVAMVQDEKQLWIVIAAACLVIANMTCNNKPDTVAEMYQHTLMVSIADNLTAVGIDPTAFYGKVSALLARIDSETRAATKQEARK